MNKEYTFEALTDIWTGDAKGKPDRTIATGLLGSIRWWFEVLVRGLGGSACDPTRHQCEGTRHCVVCELFGCTGWARKFRFDVLAEDGQAKKDQIKKDQKFKLRLTKLRTIAPEEWALLDLTIRLIAEYGAIGGKTVYKPSDQQNRENAAHHRDYGLVCIEKSPDIERKSMDELRTFARDSRWRHMKHGAFAWASLQHFWCVQGRHLSGEDADHSSFNRVLGRPESKKCRDCGEVHDPPQKCEKTKKHPRRDSDQNPTGDLEKWLAGGRAESKKVFSFKNPESARRTFGFAQSKKKLDEMKQRLREKAWKDLKDEEFVTGAEILRRLLGQGGIA